MARMLDVYLHERLVGPLIQDDGGQMSFEYLEGWVAQPEAVPISVIAIGRQMELGQR
jgi:HipA-like protein